MREEYSNLSVYKYLEFESQRVFDVCVGVICAVTVEKHVFVFTEVQFKTNCRCNTI